MAIFTSRYARVPRTKILGRLAFDHTWRRLLWTHGPGLACVLGYEGCSPIHQLRASAVYGEKRKGDKVII
eukprot:scaffold120127_cov23-Tisochrysis_lutea.AAC.1